MTKKCALKEAFIEQRLDEFQSNWRNGEDITAETKQKIRDYVVSKVPDELKDDLACLTDYSIWHMTKKIRERENLPAPKKSNKGKVSVSKPSTSKIQYSRPKSSQLIRQNFLEDADHLDNNDLIHIFEVIKKLMEERKIQPPKHIKQESKQPEEKTSQPKTNTKKES